MEQKIWVVIPAYNEGKKIQAVIGNVKKAGYTNIVVIDDGSKDNTAHMAKMAGANVLTHIINRGQGAGLQTGFMYALKHDADIVVTFDADGQHQAQEIKDLIAPIKSKEVEACLGSRFLEKKSNVSWHREFLLKGGALVMWVFYGIKLTDSHNGFRAISADALTRMELKEDKMEHASEILEQIVKKKISYKEVPVTITYTEYSLEKGQSSFAAFGILWNMIKNKVLR